MDKLDFKKEYKDLYLPGTMPSKIVVPRMTFMMADGKGDPNQLDGAYAKAVSALYTLTYTIKMSRLGGNAPEGYFEYVVPPLEGLWWYDDGKPFRFGDKEHFCWTSMIRQPSFVTEDVFAWACREAVKKKPDIDISGVRLSDFDEGLCVQCMHLGPYADEPRTVEKMENYMRDHGLVNDISDIRHHHEIYLNDPGKTDPGKLKTVIRHPVK